MECGYCLEGVPFHTMAQCADGHIFCLQCLREHVEEYTLGGYEACTFLCCLDTNGCKESFPLSEIRRSLPSDLVERYEQRQAQTDIELANLEDLVYCPFCNIPYQGNKDTLILQCPCSKGSFDDDGRNSEDPIEVEARFSSKEILSVAVDMECSCCYEDVLFPNVVQVYCPSCNIPYQVDESILVLQCPNSSCSKASCILCKEPDHTPLRCHEVEKKSETALRRKIEEAMAKAVIRVCNSCNAELVKVDGCNKVICKCGTIMCYKCRRTIPNDYSHFCRHSRDPKNPCQKCKKCGVWDTEVEDELAMAAKERAMKKFVEEEPNLLSKDIGPKLHNLSLN